MPTGRSLPTDALALIQRCVREQKVYWTYHVNMRLSGRYISRDELLGAIESYEIIESYLGRGGHEMPSVRQHLAGVEH